MSAVLVAGFVGAEELGVPAVRAVPHTSSSQENASCPVGFGPEGLAILAARVGVERDLDLLSGCCGNPPLVFA